MELVKVSASKEYTVHIGTGYLDTIGEKIREIKRLCRVVLISDDTVFSLYGERVKKSLIDSGYSVCEYVFPHGEEAKSFENYEKIAKYLKSVGSKKYVLQNYFDYNKTVIPYAAEKLKEIQKECNEYIPTTVRGII